MRITTWNVRGRDRPDPRELAHRIAAIGADVLVLQEVQRRQAAAVAGALGWRHVWAWKHWPVVVPAEGLAVLAPEHPSTAVSVVVSHRWRFWSSRRRIALVATVPTPAGPLRVADVHLGAGVGERERARQAALVAGLGEVVAGDLNTSAGSPTMEVFRAAGLRDAWSEAGEGPGHTNWRGRPRTGPAVQRLDYVLVAGGWEVLGAAVPTHGDAGFDAWGGLSDHLPVTVELRRA